MAIHPDDYEAAMSSPADHVIGADAPEHYAAVFEGFGVGDSLSSSGSLSRE